MLDTKDPEVRTGDVKRHVSLQKGDTLVLTIKREAELEPYCVEVNYDGFVNDVNFGDIILSDGGCSLSRSWTSAKQMSGANVLMMVYLVPGTISMSVAKVQIYLQRELF